MVLYSGCYQRVEKLLEQRCKDSPTRVDGSLLQVFYTARAACTSTFQTASSAQKPQNIL